MTPKKKKEEIDDRELTPEELQALREIIKKRGPDSESKSVEPVEKALREMYDLLDAVLKKLYSSEDVRGLIPYIQEILKSDEKKYHGLLVSDVIANIEIIEKTDKNGQKVETLRPAVPGLAADVFKKAQADRKATNKIRRAEQARNVQRAAAEVKEQQKGIAKSLHYNKTTNETKLTTTKFSNDFFDPMPSMEILDGQLTIISDYMPDGEKSAILTATFSPNDKQLQGLGIDPKTAQLDYGYDFFVMSALDQLYLEKNEVVTPTRILNQMGIPISQKEIDKVVRSLLIGASTGVRVNNREVLEAWGIDTTNYTEIIGNVMPIQIKREYYKVNGNLANMQIHVGSFSPFYQVSQPLGHLSTWDNKIFNLYTGRRTEKYWRVMRYLMREIAWMRNDSGKHRAPVITLQTLYAFAGDKTRADKKRTRDMTWKILHECFEQLHYIDKTKTIEDPKTGNILLQPISNDQRQKLLNG